MLRALTLSLLVVSSAAAADGPPPDEAAARRQADELAARLVDAGKARLEGIEASVRAMSKGSGAAGEAITQVASSLAAVTSGLAWSADDARHVAEDVRLVLVHAGDATPALEAVEDAHATLSSAGADPGDAAAFKALLQSIATTGRPPDVQASEALDKPAAATVPAPRRVTPKRHRHAPPPPVPAPSGPSAPR